MARVPRLYAHRGASAELPENTLPSFRRALELGADALEMDAHMTADGHVVISHDPDGRRMCGVDAAIRRTPLAEVSRWDAGWGFTQGGGRPHAESGFRVPTLEQVLGELPDVPLNIDLKQAHPSMVGPVLRLLRRHEAEDRVTLASFRLATMVAVRAAGYRGSTALPRAEVLGLLLAPGSIYRHLPLRGDAAQLPLRAGPLDLTRRKVIERCHAATLRVDFWTVNEPELARRLVADGADGIMTDDPARVAPALKRSPGRAPAPPAGAASPRR